MNIFFGPLDKRACVYFYFLSVFFSIFFIVVLLFGLVFCIRHYKKINGMFVANIVAMLIQSFIGYFVNRLMYSICVQSLI
jgi:hypothetical protein